MSKITKVWAREILDSRGLPTLEAAVMLDTGFVSVASVPSGTSTGTHEALELRDGDEKRFAGMGVLKAVANVNQILGPAILGFDPQNQTAVDSKLIELDGTENKKKLGANAILAVSLACAKAGAASSGNHLYRWILALSKALGVDTQGTLRVPTPIFNMINGGLHGAGNLDFQEFQVIPATSKPFSAGLQSGAEIYHVLKKALARRGAIHSVGDEGGYAPNLFTNVDALEILVEAIKESGYGLGRDVFLGLDVAASTFHKDGNYQIRDKSTPMDRDALINFYTSINETYHLALLEDPLFEDDWEGWTKLSGILGNQLIIIGDDLLVTNPKRVQKGIETKAANAILVKPNQIGTITETIQVIRIARGAGWKVIVSHRSAETNDYFIADFAVGVGSDYVKFGAPARGERIVKYNRLLGIEAELSSP